MFEMRITIQIIVAVALLGTLIVAVAWLETLSEHNFSGRVVVVDGDSLIIDGEKMRLSGIDAPELEQTCGGQRGVWLCGRRSREALRNLIDSNIVVCISDGIDRYQRWLVRCEIGSVELNRAMVLDGWAVSYGAYEREEDLARAAKRNLWAGEFERPSSWRRELGDAQGASFDVSGTLAKLAHAFRYLWSRWFGT